jgi:uncharacterized protein YceK
MKRLFVVAALFAVAALSTGCASVSQAVQAYGNVAVTSAKAANDTAIEAQKVALCAMPVSALVRHPEMLSAVRSLCVDAHDANTGALLDAVAAASTKPGIQSAASP